MWGSKPSEFTFTCCSVLRGRWTPRPETFQPGLAHMANGSADKRERKLGFFSVFLGTSYLSHIPEDSTSLKGKDSNRL